MHECFPRRSVLAATILVSALVLQGCAGGIGMTLLGIGASTGASTGVNHTLGGIAYKTFTVPPEDLHAATLAALGAMDMPVDKDEQGTGEQDANIRHIAATATDRDIDIEIEEVTARTSRLRVVASKDVLFKDSATATEIIMQTALALDQLQAAKARTAAARPARAVKKTNVRARSVK